ncbi:MAG: PAS domain-containing protein [Acidimicrobiales bacterium]
MDPQGSTATTQAPDALVAVLPAVLGDFAPVALMLLDDELRIVWASETTARSMKQTVDGMTGRPLRDVQRPGMLTDDVVAVLIAGLERRVDVVLAWGDGRERDVVVFPVDVAGRRRIGFAAVLITAAVHRTLDEHELRESLLTDAARLGVWRHDLSDGSVQGNSWFRIIHDVGTPETPRSRAELATRIHPDDRDRVRATIDQAVATGEPYSMTYRLVGPNGEAKTVQSRGSVVPGRPHELIGVVTDVTESEIAARREADQRLRESLLTDAAQLGVWEWDRATGRTVWNEWLERLFGYEPGTPERTFDEWASRVHPDDLAHTIAILLRAMEHGGLFESSYRVVLPDGEIRHLEGRGQLDPNDPTHVVGVVYDVTERMRAAAREAELQREALASSDAERDRIAADIHDGPLQALSAAWLRLTTMATRLDAREGDGDVALAAMAREVAQSLAETNQELRDVLGRLRSLPVDSSIDTFAHHVGDLADDLGERGEAEFAVDVDAGHRSELPGVVLATTYRIVAEGMINASAHAGAQHVDVSVRVEGDVLVATVADDGRGFDTAAPAPPGHFGLSIMRQRAEGARGTLAVHSAPGHGTRVVALLPLGPLDPIDADLAD